MRRAAQHLHLLQTRQSNSTGSGGISSWLTSSEWELVIEKDGALASSAAFPWQLELEKKEMGWVGHLYQSVSISRVPHPSPGSHIHLHGPTSISGVQHSSPGSHIHLWDPTSIFRIPHVSPGSHIHLWDPKCIFGIPHPSLKSNIHLQDPTSISSIPHPSLGSQTRLWDPNYL